MGTVPSSPSSQLSIVPTLQRGNAAQDAPASGFVQRYEMLSMNPRLSKTLPRSPQVTLERQQDIPTLERGNDHTKLISLESVQSRFSSRRNEERNDFIRLCL